MAKASGRYNACSDWLRARSEQGITHPLCPRADYGLCKLGLGLNRNVLFSYQESHIINNLITSTVRSLRENLKPRPSRINTARPQFEIFP